MEDKLYYECMFSIFEEARKYFSASIFLSGVKWINEDYIWWCREYCHYKFFVEHPNYT
jgi:hypothetical protein